MLVGLKRGGKEAVVVMVFWDSLALHTSTCQGDSSYDSPRLREARLARSVPVVALRLFGWSRMQKRSAPWCPWCGRACPSHCQV
jgi:hypothetical protein